MNAPLRYDRCSLARNSVTTVLLVRPDAVYIAGQLPRSGVKTDQSRFKMAAAESWHRLR